MSSPDFQIALSRLIASPELCRRVLNDEDDFFSGYQLTKKEKTRLQAVLRQKGMSVCCSLYRMNRITPIYTQLVNTSLMLGDELLPLVEEFWAQQPDTTLQFQEEVLGFGSFLLSKIENGLLHQQYLKEVLQLEIAINELSYVSEGNYRILQFDHDIFRVLQALAKQELPQTVVEKTKTVYKLYLQEQKLQMDLISNDD